MAAIFAHKSVKSYLILPWCVILNLILPKVALKDFSPPFLCNAMSFSLASPSRTSVPHEIQRAVPVICSYRHPVVLAMEMGGDTHSFRSITYMDDIRGLLRHRGNLVNRRTLRVPWEEEGRGGRGWALGWRKGVSRADRGRWSLLATVMLPAGLLLVSSGSQTSVWTSHRKLRWQSTPVYHNEEGAILQEEVEEINLKISYLDLLFLWICLLDWLCETIISNDVH